MPPSPLQYDPFGPQEPRAKGARRSAHGAAGAGGGPLGLAAPLIPVLHPPFFFATAASRLPSPLTPQVVFAAKYTAPGCAHETLMHALPFYEEAAEAIKVPTRRVGMIRPSGPAAWLAPGLWCPGKGASRLCSFGGACRPQALRRLLVKKEAEHLAAAAVRATSAAHAMAAELDDEACFKGRPFAEVVAEVKAEMAAGAEEGGSLEQPPLS